MKAEEFGDPPFGNTHIRLDSITARSIDNRSALDQNADIHRFISWIILRISLAWQID